MPASTRQVTQTSEIVQDTMASDNSYDTDGEILSDQLSPNTLQHIFKWIVGASKTIFGEATRRRGATRVQGASVSPTGKITSSGNVVTGSSTLFLSELEIGSWIAGPLNEYREVLAIASDTSLTLVSGFSSDVVSPSLFMRLPSLAERAQAIETYDNAIINGDLDIWNNGITFSNPASLTPLAARFYLKYDGTIGTFSISQQVFSLGQTDVPDEPTYFIRWAHTSAGSAQTVKQLNYSIPNVKTFAGKTIVLKFYAKINSGANISIGATQYFGTGGGPSSDVLVTAKTRALTTTWALYTIELAIPSLSGKSIGTNKDDTLIFNFNLPLNAAQTTDFSHFSAYVGTANLPWKRSNRETESNIVAQISDRKTQGTDGGTANATTWETRDLNTIDYDPYGIITLSTNQFTLDPGSYIIDACFAAYQTQRTRLKLYNITDSADVFFGSSTYAGPVDDAENSFLNGLVTITVQTVFEIQQYSAVTKASEGFGLASNIAEELYGTVKIQKISI